MTPELQELISLRTLVLFGAALILTICVSIARVARERAAQRREQKPLTTFGEGFADVVYGSMAALALLLLQDTIKPLPIKAAVGLAMFYGYMGPAAWDFVAAIAKGQYALTKKETPE
ncbi:hypothetical protein [Deinococcus sp. QL22]|uniref:hypothetical protein n=1 Tax=Deinococcus sp. QL22 TaxID=2939437 RepID=UPI0020178AA2|nr:hypothetical protein [Deinococcus sp. QL22]UQN06749.1 hypothetical protein M1R55_02170 [Deinococcus sp. QL22]